MLANQHYIYNTNMFYLKCASSYIDMNIILKYHSYYLFIQLGVKIIINKS